MNMNSEVIAIISGKGGTGKSTLTLSIGSLLAHCGFRTLIVDMDLFTNGLTVLATAHQKTSINHSLSDYFHNEESSGLIDTLTLQHPFTLGKLKLLPSRNINEDSSNQTLLQAGSLEHWTEQLERLIRKHSEDGAFDYVLIDTRGGLDLTSLSAVLCAHSYILMTEADKPSWAISEGLLQQCNQQAQTLKKPISAMGIVINKNVLPSKDIEAHLANKWGIPHLGTLNFEASVGAFFQQSQWALAEDPTSPFSREIGRILQRGIVSGRWRQAHLEHLKQLMAPSLMQKGKNFVKTLFA